MAPNKPKHRLSALVLNAFRCEVRCTPDLVLLTPRRLLISPYLLQPGALSSLERAMMIREVAQKVRMLRGKKMPAFLIPGTKEEPVPRIGLPGRPEDYRDLPEDEFRIEQSEFDENTMRSAADELIRWRIDRSLENRGFRQVKGRLVRDVGEYRMIRIGGERFRVRLCEQVERSVRIIRSNPTHADCLVRIDVRRAPILSLAEIFAVLRRRGYSEERAREWLLDNIETISVEPRGRAAKLVEIELKRASEVRVKTTGESLDRYWARWHGILIPRNDFVVKAQLGEGLTLPYPASTCYVILTSEYFKRPLWLHPEDRFRRIVEIAEMALVPYSYKDLIQIEGKAEPLLAEQLCEIIGWPGELGRVFMKRRRISKPKLLFWGNGTSTRILEGLRKYGPYSGRMWIDNLIIMMRTDSKLMDKEAQERFVERLRNVYEDELKLGVIRDHKFIEYKRADKADSIVRSLLSDLSGDLMITFITPGRGRPKWNFLMSIANLIDVGAEDANRIKVQVLQEEKARTIIEEGRGYKPILETLALSLYVKAGSRRDERGPRTILEKVPFILKEPADGDGVTCYGFIDISRRRKAKEFVEATVSLSVINPRGDDPRLKTVRPKQPGERIRLLTLAYTLKELLDEANGHERIVLFTDGPIVDDASLAELHQYFVKEDIRKAAEELHIPEGDIEDLREALIAHDLVIVNVVKRVMDRMFLIEATGNVNNPKPWTYLRSSDNRVLLIASEFRGVRAIRNIPTAAPVELRIYRVLYSRLLKNKDITKETIEQVLREYCALSMMDWVSPYIEPKVPAYLKFVQKAGEIITATRLSVPPPWFTV